MAIYAISDLHLSFGVNKPMNIFGEVWDNYEETVKNNWLNTVKEEDTVIIPGDISWAMTLNESLKDFEFLNSLPGKKIILRGNHDYYFSTKTKMQNFFKSSGFEKFEVLHNNAFEVENYIVCGTRGWGKTENNNAEQDKKIIVREEARLINSLNEGKRLQQECLEKGIKKDIIVALHFPPFIADFTKIMEEYGVKKCVYGHLHGFGHNMVKEGIIGNIEYTMVGCDFTKFQLIKLS
ncbi:MAG: metallophosphoesterase [Clostridia bacterium]|nr:metallophosphoesterase [Clostridia bacterium]